MNSISHTTLQKANQEAIYNVYMYLAHRMTPAENDSLSSIVQKLDLNKKRSISWTEREIQRLDILRNAVNYDAFLAKSRIGAFTRSKRGMTACTFTKPNGDISVVFKGTGSGEWIDNGEGLSGIPQKNTYIICDKGLYYKEVQKDYATEQQVEALNWFCAIAAQEGWNKDTSITLSGHSKGGNKAQFIAIHSALADTCFSFDGQGFSPEALQALKKQYGEEYEKRRQRIMSFAAANDYVNVLGERLMPKDNIYYFKSSEGLHNMEAMLEKSGRFRAQCEQGRLSEYVERVSDEIMSKPPLIRRYATLGVMNVFQKYLGEGAPLNGDEVSVEKTVAGIAIAVSAMLYNLGETKNDNL